jgi:hypothetical protein
MKLDNLFESDFHPNGFPEGKTVLPNLPKKKTDPVAKAMVQDPQFKSKVVPDKKKAAKAGYQKYKGKIEEMSVIDINGPQGNANFILGLAKKLSDEQGKNWNQIKKEMESGDYKNLLQTFDGYFGGQVELKNAEPYFEGGYEGQSEPTYHVFKGADVNDVKKTIAHKKLSADAEQSDLGVKVHTYNTDRKAVAKDLGINEGKPNWGAFPDGGRMLTESLLFSIVNETVDEGGMPSSVIKHKQKLAMMTDKELADSHHGERDEESLRKMAWSHGYGKMSSHYWDRIQKAKSQNEENQLEGLTFEDIKPYVSMYKDKETGKMTYDVLDKNGNSAYKSTDSKEAMKYFKHNFKKLKEVAPLIGAMGMAAARAAGTAVGSTAVNRIADKLGASKMNKDKMIKKDGVEESGFDPGTREELAKEIYTNNDHYQSEYDDWEAFMNSDDFEEENMRLRSKFEDAKDHDDEDPFHIKQQKEKEAKQKELDRLVKLAGMGGTASTHEATQDMNQVHGGGTKLTTPTAQKDIEKAVQPMKGIVGAKGSAQQTATGLDTLAKGDRLSNPAQIKAVQPYVSSIAKALTNPQTRTQMRNIVKKVQ